MGGWMSRNFHHHDLPLLAFTSAGGPANVAALTLSHLEGRETADIKADWIREFKAETGRTDIALIDQYNIDAAAARRVFHDHPGAMIGVYLDLVWENITVQNFLYRVQLPDFKYGIWNRMYWLEERGLNSAAFWLTMAGMLLMIVYRRWPVLLFTAVVYLYFLSMMGFTQWQGSRLFYPAQIAWSIAIAFLLVMVGRTCRGIFRRIAKAISGLIGAQSLGSRLTGGVSMPGRRLYPVAGRFYWIFYCLFILAGLLLLYRKFIFGK